MTSNVYFRSLDPTHIKRRAIRLTPSVCGRGRHLLRMAVRDGSLQIASLSDRIAVEPLLSNGYVIESTHPRGELTPTAKGRGYLFALARVE